MVITKHFAIHGKNYRSKLIKYILNPNKTKNLTLVSDFGMRNYLDFPSYEELVKMYNDNFLSNDSLYEFRHDRQEVNQRKIHSHHIIQSFSPDDHLTPEQINRIGYETVKELTGGRFRFIVATHVDKDHIHNHIILNSIDQNSDKKFLWDYKAEHNLRMVSDRLSKIAGAKIIENRYSHRQYEVYRKSNYKYEIKQRVYFLIENSKNFEDFKKKAKALHLKIDFRHKHVTFFIIDSNMKQVVRDDKLNRKQPYNETYFKQKFVQREIINILEFLLPKMKNMNELIQQAEFFDLKIIPKEKHVLFEFNGIKLSEQELGKTNQYSVSYFQDYFNNKNETFVLDNNNNNNLVELYNKEKLIKEKELPTEEVVWKSYQEFKRNREAVHELEVELNLNQIEEVVDDGIYIKVQFGIRQEGLIFVPNIQINMEEEKVKVFLRETRSYYVYHKDSAEKNRFMKGKTLIRQFTLQHEPQHMYRRIPLSKIKEKIEQLDFLISAENSPNDFENITKDFIDQISYLENMIEQVQDKIDNLSSLEEILLNDTENSSGNLEEVKISVNRIEKDLYVYKGRIEKLKKQHREAINLFEMFNRTLKNYKKTKNTKSRKENEIHLE